MGGLKPVFRLGAVVLVLGLAACAGPARLPPPASGAETAKAEIEAPTEVRRPPAPTPEVRADAKENVTEAPSPPAETRTANLAPAVNPGRIMGLTGAELRELLGKPHFRRRDITAEIWQYRHTECILDVFLYESGKGYRVLHFEMRQGKAKAASRTRCLAALLKARDKDGAGSG